MKAWLRRLFRLSGPIAIGCGLIGIALTGPSTRPAIADGVCYTASPAPTPLPPFVGYFTSCTFPAVPSPGPTSASGIPLVQPTNVPTIGVTVVNFPAPGPTNASGIPLVAPTNLPNPLPVTTPVPLPTAATGIPMVTVCDPTTANRCAALSSTPNGSDGTNGGVQAMDVNAYGPLFNGTNWDRPRKDTYVAGPQWTSDGGASTAAVAAGTGTTVVKASAGRVAGYTITTVGTGGDATCYDNASTGSGTKLFVVPGTTSNTNALLGFTVMWKPVAANGITCVGAVNSPAFTVGFF